jgi:hypothetical protein
MLSFFGVLPLVFAWVGLLLISQRLAARRVIGNNWSLHIAFACTSWGVILTLLVEVASVFHAVNGPVLLTGWLLVDAAVLLLLLKWRERVLVSWNAAKATLRDTSASCPADARILFQMIIVLVAILFGVALLTPTTNWDSLTYHLPRMLQWLQQGTVDHFFTSNSRQVEFAPWASYALLHLFVFTGGDQFLNLMQWSAMVSTLMIMPFLVISLARWSGIVFDLNSTVHGARSWRMLAFMSVVLVTVPIGVIESLTTQNDYVATLWLCCALAFAFALIDSVTGDDVLWVKRQTRIYAIGAGAAFGLGTLTKSTVFLYAAPFALAFGLWWLFRLSGVSYKIRLACLMALPFLFLNAPHMLRNQAACGSPLGSPAIFKLERNERLTPAVAASNLIRNLSLNGNTGCAPLTYGVNRVLSWLHETTGLDLNDPATTYHGCRFFFRERFLVLDSYTSNTWHVVLVGLAAAVALSRPRSHTKILIYGGLILLGVILFCVYLKWQWWHSRLHLCFLVLLAPFTSLILAQRFSRTLLLPALGIFLVLFAVVSLLMNQSRPFLSADFMQLPREEQYMAIDGKHLNKDLLGVANAIIASNGRRVGLSLAFDDAEYPLWIMLRNRGFHGRIYHTTGKEQDADVVVRSDDSRRPVDASVYRFSRKFGYYTVFSKNQPAGSELSASAR